MTRMTALHGRLAGRAPDAIRPGAYEKPSTAQAQAYAGNSHAALVQAAGSVAACENAAP
jgi:hypothetical protein